MLRNRAIEGGFSLLWARGRESTNGAVFCLNAEASELTGTTLTLLHTMLIRIWRDNLFPILNLPSSESHCYNLGGSYVCLHNAMNLDDLLQSLLAGRRVIRHLDR